MVLVFTIPAHSCLHYCSGLQLSFAVLCLPSALLFFLIFFVHILKYCPPVLLLCYAVPIFFSFVYYLLRLNFKYQDFFIWLVVSKNNPGRFPFYFFLSTLSVGSLSKLSKRGKYVAGCFWNGGMCLGEGTYGQDQYFY